MKLSFVELCGFRGYREVVRLNFGRDFTVIDGRNGVGKSTIFDAVEFTLTGTISKYAGAKANQETVDDYIWWRGSANGPEERYVEVGFVQNGIEYKVRRSSVDSDDPENLAVVARLLCDQDNVHGAALRQLCASTIIRDELIAALSLDLKETDRAALLSSAIGATGAEERIELAKAIHALSKEELKRAEEEANEASDSRAKATIQVDSARSTLLTDREFRDSSQKLADILGVKSSADDLVELGRQEVLKLSEQISRNTEFIYALGVQDGLKKEVSALAPNLESLRSECSILSTQIAAKSAELAEFPSHDQLDQRASSFAELALVGEQVGCFDDQCPLCKSEVSREQFQSGISDLKLAAEKLSLEVVQLVKWRDEFESLSERRTHAEAEVSILQARIGKLTESIQRTDSLVAEAFPDRKVTVEMIEIVNRQALQKIESIEELLPRVDTSSRSARLRRAELELIQRSEMAANLEQRLSLARRTEMRCKALYDGVRRAEGEALTLRLERILPLIAELYARLRPHPTFGAIEYKMRGELRRHLSFRVGEDVNPQFVFSSGQRRATGLAFLISVNLSLAWSRWSSLLLDDPVQHIDDFRSVHLAELLGHLVVEDKQIICAVEDSALADLLCRKMPVRSANGGARITLGLNEAGDVDVIESENIARINESVLQGDRSSLAG